jgi:hypothetical protein
MTGWGHERQISPVCNMSALPLRSRRGADILESSLRAKSGCEQSQQGSAYSITSLAVICMINGTVSQALSLS